ncbi:reticulon-3-A-like isoform X2 [Chiloscyllium plagiosum]|uniref:reticulon-3-A-like isoform X2 n=1 Tax=Chiloscyllium plagiosum TaxID=36176 RepID=UPI001CB7C1D7|nr:reticulon-3-A-like isoform X2 [Chiloscyllium plagiosum]
MESQNQSSLVTSSGESGDAAVSSSGVSLDNLLSSSSQHISVTEVKDLIYWRDPKKTGVVFGSILTLLVSLAVFSVVSVLAYLVLALLSVTISFRIYKSVVQAVQKTNDGNPFKPYLEQDITLSSETFHKYCTIGFTHLNRVLKYLLQLFLVQDLVDSLKLAVLMWLMTYVGAVFNGLTLLILAVLLTFSVPIIYQAYQTQIDHYIELVQKQATCAFGKIQEKLPGAKRKSE